VVAVQQAQAVVVQALVVQLVSLQALVWLILAAVEAAQQVVILQELVDQVALVSL
jgi:hypothetical protein